jgi:putative FmdB family regulatory protein
MPTYEYQCTDCEHRFEIWQSVGEAAPQCPECGAEVRKIFHPVRVIYKGSGFYITDSRAEKTGKSGKSGEEGGSESTSSSSGSENKSSETKPTDTPTASKS